MPISITSPVTGAAITGLTSPTYTVASDAAKPEGVTQSHYVTALGGTQAGVQLHSIASPFTVSWKHPKVLQTPGQVDNTGVLRSPSRRNSYSLITRKGGQPVTGQAERLNMIKTSFEVEAGVEKADLVQLAAMLSLHIGVLTQQKDNILQTVATGAA